VFGAIGDKANAFALFRQSEPVEREKLLLFCSDVLSQCKEKLLLFLFRQSEPMQRETAYVLFWRSAEVEMQGTSVLFPSLLFSRSESFEREIASVLFCSGVLIEWKEKLLLFCSFLFRRTAQVETQAASVLFFSLLLRHSIALDIEKLFLFCSLLFRRSAKSKCKLLLCSVLFCSGVLRHWT
jgi:hypothetical protein